MSVRRNSEQPGLLQAIPGQSGSRPTITMTLSAILIALVVLFIIATVPVWPYSRTWGLWPSGALGLILVVLLGLLMLG
ncbi:DUF3309 family protein [Microvirga sp. M2]|uniref:DUF3309 family protein n=1 Tax=Microvirga sp. M2 TaxID=3073270 RepID=UPI0039C3C2CC